MLYCKERHNVLFVYKDFDVFNGLIKTFILLSKKRPSLPFDFSVCVFKNKSEKYSKIYVDNGGELINLGFRWGSNPLIIYKLCKVLKSKRPDIVHTFILKPNIFGIIAAILSKVQVIIANDLTLTDQAPTRMRRLRDKLLYKIYIKLANKTDHVICRSESIRRELKALGLRTDTSVIPPTFDFNSPESMSDITLASASKKKGELVIGTVARLSEEKRHEDLLRAFSLLEKEHKNIRLLIVGDGPLRPHLEKEAKSLGIETKTFFAGFQLDVYSYLEDMDIFVLPSRSEGAGIAIMEAMVCGLPVVASNVGGIPDIVAHNITGILFSPGDIFQLKQALAQLIGDEALRITFGQRGKKRVHELFHPDRFIERHFLLYRTILEKKRSLNPAQ